MEVEEESFGDEDSEVEDEKEEVPLIRAKYEG